MNRHIELDHIIDTYDRPFVVIGREFTVVTVNSVYEKTFQVSRDEVEGKKCHEVLHHRDRPCFEMGEQCPYAECYMSEQMSSCLHTHYDGRGRPRWVRIKLHPMRAADGSLYVGEMLEEIGALAEHEKEEENRPVGTSQAFLHMIQHLAQAARTDAPVLLIGETGTGKELAAGFIHHHSERSGNPFIPLDCTVVTESLFESEVFGHERGAFTGSTGTKEGLFEVADGGTLFIDEIGEATLNMQAKLLRVLELGEFRRVGSNKTLAANARIVCATNRPLWERVKSGHFREDLYYRIACFCIRIPSLRERLEDLPVLCEEILHRISRNTGQTYQMTEEALDYLSGYHFPGNIRELRNILQVAVAHSPGNMISAEEVKQCLRMRDESQVYTFTDKTQAAVPTRVVKPSSSDRNPLRQTELPSYEEPAKINNSALEKMQPSIKRIEAQHIVSLLRLYGGNRRKVAEAMGVSERTLYRKLKRYDLSGWR